MSEQQVLIGGGWRAANATGTFSSENPRTGEPLPDLYPISSWKDCDDALDAATRAFDEMQQHTGEQIAAFLQRYAERIEKQADRLVETAHAETGLAKSPRLAEVELPRTTDQLRQAADAARDGSWALPTIDTKLNIRSCYAALGPVAVFGPNNFPFAFGSISGGDFAAAVAAGNPVIAKANSSHPATTRLLAIEAQAAAEETDMPAATVQLIYRTAHEDGERLVADPRLGTTGYTGSRSAGLRLKAAADAVGKPIYLELSSVNPVVILPGVLRERLEQVADEFTASCLMGTGQFCTNPGLVILLQCDETEQFIQALHGRFSDAPVGTLLSHAVRKSLEESLRTLTAAGAETVVGNRPAEGPGYCFANTLLRASGKKFLEAPETMQTEAFGNASLLVVAADVEEATSVVDHLEGNLTGGIYSHSRGEDDADYDRLAPRLRRRVGRVLNDKMPTGVAVSAAMNHGGPYPATGHPGFTAVGIPPALLRFAALHCYDNVRNHRLPQLLQDKNPTGNTWRRIDGQWTTE